MIFDPIPVKIFYHIGYRNEKFFIIGRIVLIKYPHGDGVVFIQFKIQPSAGHQGSVFLHLKERMLDRIMHGQCPFFSQVRFHQLSIHFGKGFIKNHKFSNKTLRELVQVFIGKEAENMPRVHSSLVIRST